MSITVTLKHDAGGGGYRGDTGDITDGIVELAAEAGSRLEKRLVGSTIWQETGLTRVWASMDQVQIIEEEEE
jgi:hypothetical protein